MARVKKLTVAMTKTQLFSDIAENTALTRRQVADVFEALESIIERHVQKGAVGACTIPGLMKIKVMKKPAQRARKNVPNPFRPGETMDVKAKPASTSVKVLPLKKLKGLRLAGRGEKIHEKVCRCGGRVPIREVCRARSTTATTRADLGVSGTLGTCGASNASNETRRS